MTTYDINATVHVAGRGDCAVAAKRYIQRGKHAGRYEYTLASLRKDGFRGKTYAVRTIGETYLSPAKGTYTVEQITEAVARVHTTKADIEERKEQRAAAGREVLGEQNWKRGKGWTSENVNPGDEVQIKYRGGTRRWEKVVKTNHKTGKVAIEHAGCKRGYRWIQAQQIVDTRSKA